MLNMYMYTLFLHNVKRDPAGREDDVRYRFNDDDYML